MENQVKSYERFIKKASKHPTTDLRIYHRFMLQNFQHERLIHLLVTLAFVLFTLILIFLDCFLWVNSALDNFWLLWPLHAAIILMAIIDICYVRHYYFLENHIQQLYKIMKPGKSTDD